MHSIRLNDRISTTNLSRKDLLSRCFATYLTAYAGIPRVENRIIYNIIEFKKLTVPIPSGSSTLAAYGKVMTGKTIPVIVLRPLRIIFVLIEDIGSDRKF